MSTDGQIFNQDEQFDLEYARAMRKQLIASMFSDDGKPPTDTEDISLIGKLLADNDRTTLTRAKLRIEKQANQQGNDIKKTIAEMLVRIGTNANTPVPGRVIDVDYKDVTLVQGETDIGVQAFTYEEIVQNGNKDTD